MAKASAPKAGTIAWHDLTVKDAVKVRDFYAAVVGWKTEGVDMGGYEDFTMIPKDGGSDAVAGVCHARGANADLPPQWLMYVIVDDVAKSAKECVKRGGEIVVKPRALMGGKFSVIRDPAGAVLAIYQSG